MAVNKATRRLRIRKGIRNKLAGNAAKPRLSLFRSNTNIYAQIIDDEKGHTLAATSSLKLGVTKNVDQEISKSVGKKIGEIALEKGITDVVFDRSGYLYHGRVKALADGAREAGLKF